MPQFSPFLKCYMALYRTKFTKVRQSASNLTKCCSWTNVKAKWKTKSSTWILLNEVNEDQFWGTRKSNFNEFCLPTEYLNLFCETHRNEKKWNGVQHPMKKKIWIFNEKNASATEIEMVSWHHNALLICFKDPRELNKIWRKFKVSARKVSLKKQEKFYDSKKIHLNCLIFAIYASKQCWFQI